MSRPWRDIPRNIFATDRHNEKWRQLVTTHFEVSRLQRWAALPLRLIVGYGFIAHGYAKVMNGPDHFAGALQGLGVPAPHLAAWATIGFELFGGFAVLAGAYIPLISVPLTVILLVAVITVHLPYGFSSIKLRAVTAAGPQFGPPGYETDLLYIAALATLVLGGSGPLALDARLPSFRRSRRERSQ
jgi:putative oxidoreductase